MAVVFGALCGGFLVSGGNDTPKQVTQPEQTPEADSSKTLMSEHTEHDVPS
jgi:hypothetical protein